MNLHSAYSASISTLRRARPALRTLLGKGGIGGNVDVFPDDIFITSYPKSGNTWVRFLISNLIYPGGDTDFANIDDRIPDIYKRYNEDIARMSRPRYLKSHQSFDPRYPKTLYIVRDIRSVLVSSYHYSVRRGKIDPDMSYTEFGRLFLDGSISPQYGTWKENVQSWMDARMRQPDRFLLIRYEDLISNGIEELTRITSFFEQDRSPAQIQRAYDLSKFDRMKVIEQKTGSSWADTKMSQRKNISFVRSGSSDEWQSLIDDELQELILEDCEDILQSLGYI